MNYYPYKYLGENTTWWFLTLSTTEVHYNGVFPKWNRNSMNSGNLLNHWSINWSQFKDPVSHMCLAGAVLASWPLTQEVAGSNHVTVMKNICLLNSLNSKKYIYRKFNWMNWGCDCNITGDWIWIPVEWESLLRWKTLMILSRKREVKQEYLN